MKLVVNLFRGMASEVASEIAGEAAHEIAAEITGGVFPSNLIE